jgi:hypothetical protein
MTCSEEVRKHVVEQYIAPARSKGEGSVQVRAGNVHNELHWTGRVPSVCQALGSRKFQHEAGVELVERSRPGPSTTVVFTYRLLERENPRHDVESSAPVNVLAQKRPVTLLDLFGVGKVILSKFGGGEAFLKAERTDHAPKPWERFEIEKVTFRKKEPSV